MKLLFERSRPGRCESIIPPCDVEQAQFSPSLLRAAAPRLPEIAEVDLGRHYTELASQTHGVNKGFYPLGSCTMKYNPRVNEEMAALPGFTDIHPLQPAETAQGCLDTIDSIDRNQHTTAAFGHKLPFEAGRNLHDEISPPGLHAMKRLAV